MPENVEHSLNPHSDSSNVAIHSAWVGDSETPTKKSISITGDFTEGKDAPVLISGTGELTFPAQITLSGKVSINREIKNLLVLVEYEDDKYIVSEQHFFNHAARSDFNEALITFVQNLLDGYDSLLEEEANLGEHLRKELKYLKSFIITR